MAWMQKQSHRLDYSTKLICRYHWLSTRFELIAESLLNDVSDPEDAALTTLAENLPMIPIPIQVDRAASPAIKRAWSQLVLRKHLYYLPQKIDTKLSSAHLAIISLAYTYYLCGDWQSCRIRMFGCEKASFPHPLAICKFYRIVAGAKLKSLIVSTDPS